MQIRFDLLSDLEMAKDVRNIRTWWSLPNDQINHVIAAGRRLLKDDPCFRKFIAQSRVHSMNEQLQPWTPGTCRADSADSNGLPESSSASLNGRRRENPSAR